MARIIVIFFAVFILAPIGLTILLGGLSMGIGAVSMAYLFGQSSGTERILKKAEWNVVNVLPGSGFEKSYSALVKRGELYSDRTVRINAVMSFENIRGNDQTPVDPADHATYARLAGPRLARAECDALQSALASKCVVSSVRIDRIANKHNIFEVNMELLYVEKAEMGTVAPGLELSFVETSHPLRRNGVVRHRTDRLSQPNVRADFYRDAVALCQRQRVQLGNCSIQDLRVNVRYDQRADMVEIEAYADIAILQAQTGLKQADNHQRR